MTENNVSTREPKDGEITFAYIIYGLHSISAISGILSPAFIITAFLTGWPSIVAVVLTYMKRSDVQGTFLESHFSWTLRTFWLALLWVVVGWILFITIVGLVFAIAIWIGAGLWVLYRIARGFLKLLSEEPISN